MTEFIKIGEKIQVKPNGLDYDLIPGKVYDLKWDNFNDYTYLQENGDLNLPKKLYKFEGDDKFIKRCLTYFNSENSGETTGVLLSGLKGSGKSVLAKRLARESNLPIIIVDPEYRLCRIEKFFKEVFFCFVEFNCLGLSFFQFDQLVKFFFCRWRPPANRICFYL